MRMSDLTDTGKSAITLRCGTFKLIINVCDTNKCLKREVLQALLAVAKIYKTSYSPFDWRNEK